MAELGPDFRLLMAVLCSLVAAGGLATSGTAFLTVAASEERRRSPFYILLAGLAGANSLVCATLVHVAANYELRRGDESVDCVATAGVLVYLSAVHGWMLAAIALNRYAVIVNSRRDSRLRFFATARGAYASVGAVCLISLVVLAPHAARLGRLGYDARGQVCYFSTSSSGYGTYYYILSAMLYTPFFAMIWCYVQIITKIRKNIVSLRSQCRDASGVMPPTRVKRLRKMLRSAVHCAAIPVVQFLCWFPVAADMLVGQYTYAEEGAYANYRSPLLFLLAFFGDAAFGALILTAGNAVRMATAQSCARCIDRRSEKIAFETVQVKACSDSGSAAKWRSTEVPSVSYTYIASSENRCSVGPRYQL